MIKAMGIQKLLVFQRKHVSAIQLHFRGFLNAPLLFAIMSFQAKIIQQMRQELKLSMKGCWLSQMGTHCFGEWFKKASKMYLCCYCSQGKFQGLSTSPYDFRSKLERETELKQCEQTKRLSLFCCSTAALQFHSILSTRIALLSNSIKAWCHL